MDLADLRIFEAVARLGGMNRAAAELNMVQSNVTARIRLLEDRLGVPLFERHSRGVSLTGAGQRLLPFAVEAQRLLEDARRAVTDDGTPKGRLTIGSLETTAALRLSPLLTRYASLYPAVDLVLRTGTTQEMIDAVLDHRLEGAFVCGPVSHPDLDETMIFREELVVVTAPTIPSLTGLAARSDLKLVVFRAGCSYRQRLEALLARRGLVGLRLLEFGTLDAIIGCIAAGIGISLLPHAVVEQAAAAGRVRLHDLPAGEAQVETVFVSRAGAYRSNALSAFLDLSSASTAAELAA
jgi:DNA-binding transcriptional LysR family regulator